MAPEKAVVVRVVGEPRGVAARHEPRSRHGTNVAADMKLAKGGPLCGEPINVGGNRVGMPVTGQVAKAQIVGEDEQKVGTTVLTLDDCR